MQNQNDNEVNKVEEDWKNGIINTAMNFSGKMEQSFDAHLGKAESKVIDKTEDNLKILVSIMIDYLIGTTAALCAKVIGDDEAAQEYCVRQFNDKFKFIRDEGLLNVTPIKS